MDGVWPIRRYIYERQGYRSDDIRFYVFQETIGSFVQTTRLRSDQGPRRRVLIST